MNLLKNNMNKKNILIGDIINFLEENIIDIEMHKGEEKIKELIKEFKKNIL